MSNSNNNRNINSRVGFTLLEVLVSSAILAIVMAILLHVLSTSMTTWGVTQGKIEVDVEGRSAYLLLMQDVDNIILTKDVKLWPMLRTNSGMVSLAFLTTKPLDYQGSLGGDVGDVCYVEYHLDLGKNSLLRSFYPSKWTYENVLSKGQGFPPSSLSKSELLSTNVLKDFRNAVRVSPLYVEANTNGFVILATNNPSYSGTILPISGSYNSSNPPVGVEVNLAVTDMLSARNPQLLDNKDYKLRNSGFYSFRLSFPQFSAY